MSILCVFRKFSLQVTTLLVCTGAPSLYQTQKYVKRLKVLAGGHPVQNVLEFKQLCIPLLMPPNASDLVFAADGGVITTTPSRMFVIPLQASDFSVSGECFTGPQQIKWIGQLGKIPFKFVLHIDGKYKLHHGKWILITIGVHVLRWDAHHSRLVTSFVPLIYLFCKEHESQGAADFIMAALNKVSMQYYGVKLLPGAMVSDHCAAFRNAFYNYFPEGVFGQCYPHIKRKYGEGEYTSKKWIHFHEAGEDIKGIHLAGTPEMKELITDVVGASWDSWGTQMNVFWDSNCVAPWDCWSICDLECMLATPSNQTPEAWHRDLLRKKIPGMFKASTSFVVNKTLPQLALMDGLAIPNVLNFEVTMVPTPMMEKALWYVEHQDTHIKITKDRNGTFIYYVLGKNNPWTFKKIGTINLNAYMDACNGKQHPSCNTKEKLLKTCQSFHFLFEDKDSKYGVPFCHYNPASLTCPSCKGFKHVGICSHVLAINHILEHIDVNYLLGKVQKAKKIGGHKRNVRPALQCESDSSDDDAPNLLQT